MLLGELFLQQGRGELATKEFERAVELGPKGSQPGAKVRAAEVYLAEGREIPRALRYLEDAQREGAGNVQLLSRIASVYSAPGAPPEIQTKAAGIWRQVAVLNPSDLEARLRVAVAPLLGSLPSKPELEAILESLDSTIRANPEFEPGRVRYFRALTLERLGRKEDASRAYREVALLRGVSPMRGRGGDAELDAAIQAMRALQESPENSSDTRPDSSPTRPDGRDKD
jgi:tetratricopeptide (TPR) repeat protein